MAYFVKISVNPSNIYDDILETMCGLLASNY